MVDELDKDQSTVALEEGLDKEQNGELEKTPAESGLKRLHIMAAVGLLASIVFAVVFPAVYVSKKLRIEPSSSNGNYAKSPVITRGPFNASMEFFSKDILNGYNSSDQLSNDIEQAAYFMLNQVVERNSQQDTSGQPGATFATADGESGNSAGIAAGKSAVSNDVNDYGTNNQENQVEEGDVLVSDGTHGMTIEGKCCHDINRNTTHQPVFTCYAVFAAYGDYLVIWNPRNGTMVAQVKMPTLKEFQAEVNGTRRAMKIADGGFIMYQPKPNIQTLALQGSRLLVVVNGYGDVMRKQMGIATPVLWAFLSTHLRLYDVSSLSTTGKINLIGTSNVNGDFNGLRIVNGNAHVLTVSGINTYDYLEAPVARWNFNDTISEEEYKAAVKNITEEKNLTAVFAQELTNELEVLGTMPDLVKICLWQDQPSDMALESATFANGAMNALAQIHSLSMSDGSASLQISSAGSFLPGYSARFYGATDTLIIAGEGWHFNTTSQTSSQSTYFIGFSIGGSSSLPHSVGSVDGYVSLSDALLDPVALPR